MDCCFSASALCLQDKRALGAILFPDEDAVKGLGLGPAELEAMLAEEVTKCASVSNWLGSQNMHVCMFSANHLNQSAFPWIHSAVDRCAARFRGQEYVTSSATE